MGELGTRTRPSQRRLLIEVPGLRLTVLDGSVSKIPEEMEEGKKILSKKSGSQAHSAHQADALSQSLSALTVGSQAAKGNVAVALGGCSFYPKRKAQAEPKLPFPEVNASMPCFLKSGVWRNKDSVIFRLTLNLDSGTSRCTSVHTFFSLFVLSVIEYFNLPLLSFYPFFSLKNPNARG